MCGHIRERILYSIYHIGIWMSAYRRMKLSTFHTPHGYTKCIKDSNIRFECRRLPEEGTMAKHHCTTLAVVSDAFLKHRLPKQRQKPQLLSQNHKLLHSEGMESRLYTEWEKAGVDAQI